MKTTLTTEPTLKQLTDVMIAMRKIWHIDQTENYHKYYLELDKLILDKKKADENNFNSRKSFNNRYVIR